MAYVFPSIEDLKYTIELLRKTTDIRLISSIKKFEQSSVSNQADYDGKLRLSYCAVNLVLNERDLIAPAFRPFRRLKNHTLLTPDEIDLGGDRQIIDLHYLYCNYRDTTSSADEKYRPLFKGESFNFKLASDFANEEWKAETKAIKSLKLPDRRQYELGVLKSKKVADRIRNIYKKLPEIEMALINYVSMPKSRKTQSNIPQLLEDYLCLKFAEGSPSNAVEFKQLKSGHHIESNKLRTARETMRKNKCWFEEKIKVLNW